MPIKYYLQIEDIRQSEYLYLKGTLWNVDAVMFPFEEDDKELIFKRCPRPHSDEHVGILIRRCNENEFCLIGETDFRLILSVKLKDRVTVYSDKEWMNEGRIMNEDNEIVLRKLGDELNLFGKIRIKGPIYEYSPAIYFGIKLSPEFAGRGTSDGTFRGVSYFSCEENCGHFCNLFYIRLRNNMKVKKVLKHALPLDISVDVSMDQPPSPKTKLFAKLVEPRSVSPDLRMLKIESDKEKDLEIGGRVIWVKDTFSHYGTLRWVGQLPGEDTVYGGVEFDSTVSIGKDEYEKYKLFEAKVGFGSVLPLNYLIKVRDPEEKILSTEGGILSEFDKGATPGCSTLLLDEETGIKLRQPLDTSIKKELSLVSSVLGRPLKVTTANVHKFCSPNVVIQVDPEINLFAKIIYALFSFNESLDSFFSRDVYTYRHLHPIYFERVQLSYSQSNNLKERLCVTIIKPLRELDTNIGNNISVFERFISDMVFGLKKHYLFSMSRRKVSLCTMQLMELCLEPSIVLIRNIKYPEKSSVQEALEESKDLSLFLDHISNCPVFMVNLENIKGNRIIPSSVLNLSSIVVKCYSCKTPLSCDHCYRSQTPRNSGVICLDCRTAGLSKRQSTFCSDCYDHYHSNHNMLHVRKTETHFEDSDHFPFFPYNLRWRTLTSKSIQQMELFAVIFEVKHGRYGTFVKTSSNKDAPWLVCEESGTIRCVPQFDDFLRDCRTSPSGSYEDILHKMIDNLQVCYYRPVQEDQQAKFA